MSLRHYLTLLVKIYQHFDAPMDKPFVVSKKDEWRLIVLCVALYTGQVVVLTGLACLIVLLLVGHPRP